LHIFLNNEQNDLDLLQCGLDKLRYQSKRCPNVVVVKIPTQLPIVPQRLHQQALRLGLMCGSVPLELQLANSFEVDFGASSAEDVRMAPAAASAAAVALIVALPVAAGACINCRNRRGSRVSIKQATKESAKNIAPTFASHAQHSLPLFPIFNFVFFFTSHAQHPLLFFPTFTFFFFFAFDSSEAISVSSFADGPSGRTMTWSKACGSPEMLSMPLKPHG